MKLAIIIILLALSSCQNPVGCCDPVDNVVVFLFLNSFGQARIQCEGQLVSVISQGDRDTIIVPKGAELKATVKYENRFRYYLQTASDSLSWQF